LKKLIWNLNGPSAMSYDPVRLAKMKAEGHNRTPGTLTGLDCPKCLNNGRIAVVREDVSIAFIPCQCMKVRRCFWEMERSGLKNSIRELTFDSYQATEPWQIRVKEGAEAYAKEPKGWLLLAGQPGCGKTHLCTAVCRSLLLQGKEVRYMSWREKVNQIKSAPMEGGIRASLLEELKKAEYLYIDDLFKTGTSTDGSCNPTQADGNLAFELLNYRYNNRLPTIISTERTPQELVKIDEATGSRILEMAGEHIYSIGRDKDRNYRLRQIQML